MDIQSAYKEAGTLRGAAAICGTTHKTVKRILEAAERAEAGVAVKQERNFDGVRGVVAEKIDTCQGRISAKRLLPLARAAGYEGSPRNFRRLVAGGEVEVGRCALEPIPHVTRSTREGCS